MIHKMVGIQVVNVLLDIPRFFDNHTRTQPIDG